MKDFVNKLIKRLQSEVNYNDGAENGAKQSIAIVNELAEEYEDCYKDCGECEAYNKEKHHCPKFCKVITEAVKEIEENHRLVICSEYLPDDGEIHEVTAQFSNGMTYTEFAYYDVSRNEWWKYDDRGRVNVIAWRKHTAPYQP